MTEGTPDRPPQSGGRNEGVDEDVAASDDEGRRNADATPRIADDTVPGQDTSPAAPDDVGVPPDEEMNDPDR